MKICSRFCFYFCCLTYALNSTALGQPVLLYDQDFENPAAFVNDGGDVNIFNSVNELYGGQPPGFTFAQANTVETLFINGSQAFGTGYSDPSGIGGDYALGLLSDFQNDLLGLSFDIGDNDFLVVQADISSIDLSVFGGPFVSPDDVPIFEYSLFDNPSGISGLDGNGVLLDTAVVAGTASPQDTFDWTAIQVALDGASATNGNVTLRIDLLQGGYGALDNFRIFASETPSVPEPGSSFLVAVGGMLILVRRQSRNTRK